MQELLLLALPAITSAGAYLLGRRRLGLSPRALVAAIDKTLECLGLTVLFYGLNLGIGVLGILAARRFSGAFVSLYSVADVMLLVLSLLQALVFAWWRDRRPPKEHAPSAVPVIPAAAGPPPSARPGALRSLPHRDRPQVPAERLDGEHGVAGVPEALRDVAGGDLVP
jgi:hypothetical protein